MKEIGGPVLRIFGYLDLGGKRTLDSYKAAFKGHIQHP